MVMTIIERQATWGQQLGEADGVFLVMGRGPLEVISKGAGLDPPQDH